MATIFTHAAVAAVIKKSFKKISGPDKKVLFWCLLLSILPDADVLSFKLGIAYEHPLGHRGFTHSILFVLIISPLVSFIVFNEESRKTKYKLTLVFALSLFSHAILDALTNGGLGVGFFIPFDNNRYFFPWTPIEVSPIGRNFFSMNGVRTLLSELKVVIIPITVIVLIKIGIKRYKKS